MTSVLEYTGSIATVARQKKGENKGKHMVTGYLEEQIFVIACSPRHALMRLLDDRVENVEGQPNRILPESIKYVSDGQPTGKDWVCPICKHLVIQGDSK